MVYFDEKSPLELIGAVVKMDAAIQATEDKMAMIMRDAALQHAYDMRARGRRRTKRPTGGRTEENGGICPKHEG